MDIPIINSPRFKGYFLRFDPLMETFSLFDSNIDFIKSIKLDELVSLLLETKNNSRRRKLRANISIKINYQTSSGTWQESMTGTLGTGGLFIETPDPIKKGTTLSIKFALPDTPLKTIEAKGKVVWTRARFEKVLYFPGMGVEFTDISRDQASAISRLIEAINKSRGIEQSS